MKNSKRTKPVSKKSKHKYAKPLSLYPLKPEEALAMFMKVDPKRIKGRDNKGLKIRSALSSG